MQNSAQSFARTVKMRAKIQRSWDVNPTEQIYAMKGEAHRLEENN